MAGPTTAFQTGVHGSRPAASAGCILYSCTTHSLIYRSDGSSWATYATLGTSSTTIATDPIWDTAGDLAVGSGADTASKLAIGAVGAHLSRLNGTVQWNSGTSNPTGATGDRYWRSDLALEIYYDGTRWLTTQVFKCAVVGFSTGTNGAGQTMTPDHLGGALGLDMWVTKLDLVVGVFGTNNGSNFWPWTIDKRASNDGATTIASGDTSAVTASTWTKVSTAINASVTASSNFRFLLSTGTKTGTPANFQANGGFLYRLIVT